MARGYFSKSMRSLGSQETWRVSNRRAGVLDRSPKFRADSRKRGCSAVCEQITSYSEVEQRTITRAMNWLSRRCDRVRIDKRAWDNASDVVQNPGAMPTCRY